MFAEPAWFWRFYELNSHLSRYTGGSRVSRRPGRSSSHSMPGGAVGSWSISSGSFARVHVSSCEKITSKNEGINNNIQTLLCALFYFCARALNFVLTIAHHSISKNVSSSHHTQLVGGGVAPLRLASGKSLLFCNAYSSLPGNNHCPLRGDIYGSLPGNICQCPAWASLQSLPGRFSSSLPGNACFFFLLAMFWNTSQFLQMSFLARIQENVTLKQLK